ncbi:MAG: DUF1080 domain-containing protein [Bryobacteraceae bacterium]|nr:DUF1080 domain-containing protein [Bryobacteraceae bacterium]
MRLLVVSLALALICTGAEKGFTPLFNGKDLSGWTLVNKKGDGYQVKDGAIVCANKGGGNLLSERDFANFVLRFEFKLPPGGNNGIGLRAPLSGDVAYSGMEIQILDHDHQKYKGLLQPWQKNGSLYNVFPAASDNLRPAGSWNEQEIVAEGSKIRVSLNGKTILDADISTVKDPEVLKKHPGLQRTSGRVGFLGHNDPVEFRNIRIKEL